mmetsp:Transcript_39910/g.73642  ORF Transcript_39910/g.73642 Transcript_39910/m.73642 type:complete len:217 (-) Transcript_39910:321-971(-)
MLIPSKELLTSVQKKEGESSCWHKLSLHGFERVANLILQSLKGWERFHSITWGKRRRLIHGSKPQLSFNVTIARMSLTSSIINKSSTKSSRNFQRILPQQPVDDVQIGAVTHGRDHKGRHASLDVPRDEGPGTGQEDRPDRAPGLATLDGQVERQPALGVADSRGLGVELDQGRNGLLVLPVVRPDVIEVDDVIVVRVPSCRGYSPRPGRGGQVKR